MSRDYSDVNILPRLNGWGGVPSIFEQSSTLSWSPTSESGKKMRIEEMDADALWRCYQRGYHSLLQSGLYFRQIVRPALSHVYFQRAVPLLIQYAQANHGASDLSPTFGEQLEACPLSPRDLLHLDYAICLGLAEEQGHNSTALNALPVMDWPGLGASNGVFVAADAILSPRDMIPEEAMGAGEAENGEEEYSDLEDEDEGSKPPFDL